jgi:hypothetical protein
MIFRTKTLEAFTAHDLAERARATVAKLPADVHARTAAFLLLKDSRSSFEIEGDDPPQVCIQRRGKAISEAGRRPIDLEQLLCGVASSVMTATYLSACARKAALTRRLLPVHISAPA